MQVVIDALNWICGLGPMCMMPIIMFVIGICLRVKIGTLLKCQRERNRSGCPSVRRWAR